MCVPTSSTDNSKHTEKSLRVLETGFVSAPGLAPGDNIGKQTLSSEHTRVCRTQAPMSREHAGCLCPRGGPTLHGLGTEMGA